LDKFESLNDYDSNYQPKVGSDYSRFHDRSTDEGHTTQFPYLRGQYDQEISFSNSSENYCISVVDIVDSTSIAAAIRSHDQFKIFYSLFINIIAGVIKDYSGKILKTLGDGLIAYYPKTSNADDPSAFRQVLECCLTQLASRCNINSHLNEQKLPPISYRISIDYGKVELAKSISNTDDLFGSTINLCSKINKAALPNSIVIGNDLHRIAQSFSEIKKEYHFEPINSFAMGNTRYSYPLYSFSRADSNKNSMLRSVVARIEKYGQRFSSSQNIMLIDDDADILMAFRGYLEHEGYNVNTYSNPETALEHFSDIQGPKYDLIITDIRMPNMNGLNIYYKFKSIDPTVKILFVSALDVIEEITSIMTDVKFDHFIRKPVERRNFIKIVKKFLP
jgi:CheY-like chemotaxis protein